MCQYLIGNFVAERIKDLCSKKNMSQYELAKRAGMTQSSVSTLLNKGNVPRITTLEKVCQGFGITLAQFSQADSDTCDSKTAAVILNYLPLFNGQSNSMPQA